MSWFIYQPKTEPVFVPVLSFNEDKFHFTWSEPVRIKPGLHASLQQFQPYNETARFPEVVFEDKWHYPWSEPIVKTKARLLESNQQAVAFQFPFVSFSWFNWLTEPKRDKPLLITGDQPFLFFEPAPFVSFSWYNWLTEPVRLPIGLKKELQTVEFFNTFIPIQYLANMPNVIELGDFLNAVLTQFAPPKQATVSIIETGFATNLLKSSQVFSQPPYLATEATITPNATIAPDGTLTASNLIPSTNSVPFHFIEQDIIVPIGATSTVSAFVKNAGYNFVVIQISDTISSALRALVDLTTGTISRINFIPGDSSAVLTNSSVQALPNGWFRISLSGFIPARNVAAWTLVAFNVIPGNSGGIPPPFAGDGTSGISMWGAQLELGNQLSVYIPTPATAIANLPIPPPRQASVSVPQGRVNIAIIVKPGL